MRRLSYILIVLGVILLALAAYDEASGTTHMPLQLFSFHRHTYNGGYLYRRIVRRSEQPELFRQFMTRHWIYAGLIAGVGCALYITTDPPKNE